MNKKIIFRLLLFFIGFPALIAVIILLPYMNHLAINILLIMASVLGTLEISALFSRKGHDLDPVMTTILGALLPVVSYLEIQGLLPPASIVPAIALGLSLVCIRKILAQKNDEIESLLFTVSAGFLMLLYPGFFIYFIIKITSFNYAPNAATILLIFFCCVVYLNDSVAYAAGILFGKKSRNLVPISPNKSLTGFIAGVCASIAVSILAKFLFPGIFTIHISFMIFIGLMMGIASIAGDLVESAFKRSADAKDSGNIIPGRGGLLDSIDSLLLAAPLFYYCMLFISEHMDTSWKTIKNIFSF